MRARIERQIKQRTQMLSGVSHDLRTPLTRLKLSLALEKQSEGIKDMLDDVNSMEAMLDEFLDFSREGQKEITQKFLFVDFLSQLISRNKKHFSDISLNISSPLTDRCKVEARANGLYRALQNVIDNATTFGTKVEIKATKDPVSFVINIEDNGPGIKKDNYEQALKAFSRLDESRNQNSHSGVGLGLTIAADIIRNHGGKISLYKSIELGGLGVTMTIPN